MTKLELLMAMASTIDLMPRIGTPAQRKDISKYAPAPRPTKGPKVPRELKKAKRKRRAMSQRQQRSKR